MKKDDIRTLIVVVVACLLFSILLFILNHKNNYEKLNAVNDYGEFFSISNDVSEYIDYVSNNSEEKILSVLDSRYIDTNSITLDNVLKYVGNYSSLTSFKANSISYVKLGGNYLYYVRGSIIENDLDSTSILDDNYRVVVLIDNSNDSYSIYPVDDNYEKIINSIRNISIDNNIYNTSKRVNNFKDIDICKLYYFDFINYIYTDRNGAYKLLNDNMLKKYSNYNDFNSYIVDNFDKIAPSTKLCNVTNFKDRDVVYVVDSKDNVYTFDVKSVMNYKVKFLLKGTENKE